MMHYTYYIVSSLTQEGPPMNVPMIPEVILAPKGGRLRLEKTRSSLVDLPASPVF